MITSPDQTDQQVLQANRRFYQAIEDWDEPAMASLWLYSPDVTCFHPGWDPLYGYDAILDSWNSIFNSRQPFNFRLIGIRTVISGDLAVVTLLENLIIEQDGRVAEVFLPATNIFRFHEGRWFLIHHQASAAVEKG